MKRSLLATSVILLNVLAACSENEPVRAIISPTKAPEDAYRAEGGGNNPGPGSNVPPPATSAKKPPTIVPAPVPIASPTPPSDAKPDDDSRDPVDQDNNPPVVIDKGVSANVTLDKFYSVRSNYDRVYAKVQSWFVPRFKTMSNSCVAFMSTALGLAGFVIPEIIDEKGESNHTLTKPFSDYLEKRLGWTRITNPSSLQPGDVVFTLANDSSGYPAHTYMFHRWENASNFIAVVVDNGGFLRARNVKGRYAEYNFTPFWYALRHVP